MEEIWGLIENHLKETINLNIWTQEDFAAEANERQILYEWGIWQFFVNNLRPCNMLNPPRSLDFWKMPPNGAFKCNFDGAAKGNPSSAGYGGAIRDSKGRIINIF